MSVLVLAKEQDPSADAMVITLQGRGVEVHRVDTAWFPERLSVSARLNGGWWSGHLRTEYREIDLEALTSIWYRSPGGFRFPAGLNTAERAHANAEAKYGLGGVLASLPVLWVNHPSRLADSAYKPLQLTTAARCGLTVADTLITNDPARVASFVAEGATVTKMFGAISIVEDGVRRFAHTRVVDDVDLADLRGIEHTAHQLQRWASKAHEARMIVIGDHITTTEIHAHSDAARVDWRSDYDRLTYQLVDPPVEVIDGVRCLMAEMGLVYGALDFVVGPDDVWTFLEINGAGQYGWIEDATGAPLTDQLADLLTKGMQ